MSDKRKFGRNLFGKKKTDEGGDGSASLPETEKNVSETNSREDNSSSTSTWTRGNKTVTGKGNSAPEKEDLQEKPKLPVESNLPDRSNEPSNASTNDEETNKKFLIKKTPVNSTTATPAKPEAAQIGVAGNQGQARNPTSAQSSSSTGAGGINSKPSTSTTGTVSGVVSGGDFALDGEDLDVLENSSIPPGNTRGKPAITTGAKNEPTDNPVINSNLEKNQAEDNNEKQKERDPDDSNPNSSEVPKDDATTLGESNLETEVGHRRNPKKVEKPSSDEDKRSETENDNNTEIDDEKKRGEEEEEEDESEEPGIGNNEENMSVEIARRRRAETAMQDPVLGRTRSRTLETMDPELTQSDMKMLDEVFDNMKAFDDGRYELAFNSMPKTPKKPKDEWQFPGFKEYRTAEQAIEDDTQCRIKYLEEKGEPNQFLVGVPESRQRARDTAAQVVAKAKLTKRMPEVMIKFDVLRHCGGVALVSWLGAPPNSGYDIFAVDLNLRPSESTAAAVMGADHNLWKAQSQKVKGKSPPLTPYEQEHYNTVVGLRQGVGTGDTEFQRAAANAYVHWRKLALQRLHTGFD